MPPGRVVSATAPPPDGRPCHPLSYEYDASHHLTCQERWWLCGLSYSRQQLSDPQSGRPETLAISTA